MGLFKNEEEKRLEAEKREISQRREEEESMRIKKEREEMEDIFSTFLLTCSAEDYCKNAGVDIKEYRMKRLSSYVGHSHFMEDAMYNAQKQLVEKGKGLDAEVIIGVDFSIVCSHVAIASYSGTALISKDKKIKFS